MAADGAGQAPGTRPPPDTATPGARLRWLLAVVTVMALLTAGWPLLNSAVADRRTLTAGSALTIGPSRADSAAITVGPGWFMRPAESDPVRSYSLSRGSATLLIAYVTLASRSQAPRLWGGLRQILQISNPGASLRAPTVITSRQGRAGTTGTVTGRRTLGAATVFVAPSRKFAIEMIVIAPRGTRGAALVAAAGLLVRSLRFPVAPG